MWAPLLKVHQRLTFSAHFISPTSLMNLKTYFWHTWAKFIVNICRHSIWIERQNLFFSFFQVVTTTQHNYTRATRSHFIKTIQFAFFFLTSYVYIHTRLFSYNREPRASPTTQSRLLLFLNYHKGAVSSKIFTRTDSYGSVLFCFNL